jgi:hypothetical protein
MGSGVGSTIPEIEKSRTFHAWSLIDVMYA